MAREVGRGRKEANETGRKRIEASEIDRGKRERAESGRDELYMYIIVYNYILSIYICINGKRGWEREEKGEREREESESEVNCIYVG